MNGHGRLIDRIQYKELSEMEVGRGVERGVDNCGAPGLASHECPLRPARDSADRSDDHASFTTTLIDSSRHQLRHTSFGHGPQLSFQYLLRSDIRHLNKKRNAEQSSLYRVLPDTTRVPTSQDGPPPAPSRSLPALVDPSRPLLRTRVDSQTLDDCSGLESAFKNVPGCGGWSNCSRDTARIQFGFSILERTSLGQHRFRSIMTITCMIPPKT